MCVHIFLWSCHSSMELSIILTMRIRDPLFHSNVLLKNLICHNFFIIHSSGSLVRVHYTPWTIKTCHFVFDYNSGVSCSIFIFFIPVETGRNTLQFTYLMAWWCHNTVTTHVIKFYFIQLVLKIKYVVFEDRPIFIFKNPWECKSFLPEDW